MLRDNVQYVNVFTNFNIQVLSFPFEQVITLHTVWTQLVSDGCIKRSHFRCVQTCFFAVVVIEEGSV